VKIETLEPSHLPFGKGVRILDYNKDGVLVLEKPTGLMSHPNRKEDEKRSLLNAYYDFRMECYRWVDAEGQEREADLIHRLDSATSGVILLSLNRKLTPVIKDLFARHKVTKIYYALVKGSPKGVAGVWDDRLMKDRKNGNRIIRNAVSVRAKSRYQLIRKARAGFPLSLIKLFPVTGRTHQLRLQCSKHKIPIVGDQTYGSFSFNRDVKSETRIKRLMLHSSEIIFSYYFNGVNTKVQVSAPLPLEFDALLDFRPGMDMEKLLIQKSLMEQNSKMSGR